MNADQTTISPIIIIHFYLIYMNQISPINTAEAVNAKIGMIIKFHFKN